ncbi:MAG: PAS domain-containing protein [Gammaproteobacteria bacterium]|nr:PAS domain-containing protein [Gammaproteobacteria bacterium]
MRLEIHCEDRVGITLEILAIVVRHGINLSGVEIGHERVYLRMHEIDPDEAARLNAEIARIPGVSGVAPVALMPTERQHFALDTLIDALPDPVLSVDGQGRVRVANAAARRLAERSGKSLMGKAVLELLPDLEVLALGWRQRKRLAGKAVQVGAQHFHAEVLPLGDEAGLGAVLWLKPESGLLPLAASLSECREEAEGMLLRRLYQETPSTRRLAERLGVSHTTVARKLRAYGISL